ncbi:DUF4450 domain-containing protein [Pedobacter sp.]|uniref:DUF4450 domain-containing protein n=1 Tax=Pedobacter sp. TaxID=1411316 RepID=UPI003BAA4508
MKHFYSLIGLCLLAGSITAQELYPPQLPPNNWHDEARELRYHPEGRDFVIRNGTRRFNRALYGTHTAFRVEAGDLPEFALYMPGLGGNLQLGLLGNGQSKWLIRAENVVARYRPGTMHYLIKDPLLGKGSLTLEVLALSKAEGLVIKARFENVPQAVKLFWAFGGASDKKFSRSGDMGPDPESVFYLHKENCKNNLFTLKENGFTLKYGKDKSLTGSFPGSELKLADATAKDAPAALKNSVGKDFPVVVGERLVENAKDFYFLIQNPENNLSPKDWKPADQFLQAEQVRKALANRIVVNTPDAYINTVGGALAIAADAIWESPSYMHGAIGWRMRLNGWRGPYAADPLGWHDRARTHFSAYAKSQVISPESGPVVPDTALNFARSKEKLGTAMFSKGYISRDPDGKSLRPHHYDMNLVYIDQLLWHFNWTGDLAYAKEMWPVIQRHLAWEKRVFDADNDGLYDAYAAIWASDALQYSGGAVTHSSAYNYRSNIMAAKIARLLKEDPSAYQNEATKILKAINQQLWMPEKGWFAEYKDAMGLGQKHPSAGLWTIYHSIDSDVPDAFQAWQSLRYIDTQLPHIPVRAKGLVDHQYYALATTNWMPYQWSLNNVVLAENTHTALAYWQAGRIDEAYKIWKSEILASMYLGGSPGNFVQISHYDANRGEAYRDFADPVGINARALVEGLFGIVPDALGGTLNLRPGLPGSWDHAALEIPDVNFKFKRTGRKEEYWIKPRLQKKLRFKMRLRARGVNAGMLLVNGKQLKWKNVDQAIGYPEIEFEAAAAQDYHITINWEGTLNPAPAVKDIYHTGEALALDFKGSQIDSIKDPQEILKSVSFSKGKLNAVLKDKSGDRTFFVKLRDGRFSYWYPVCFQLVAAKQKEPVPLDLSAADWKGKTFEPIDLSAYFNDQISHIFKNKYLSPRPQTTTLQLPLQGIGDWPHPDAHSDINDAGLRTLAGASNQIRLSSGVLWNSPSNPSAKNIIYTSQWDNYPKELKIPVAGQASAVFFLLAGSTNPMQSRMDNGLITVGYTDGTADTLALRNPENWWPIEQDLYTDGFAFNTGADRPLRIHLKTGLIVPGNEGKEWNGKTIPGGAATGLGIRLNKDKILSEIKLNTLSNDVVIGLIGVTLLR